MKSKYWALLLAGILLVCLLLMLLPSQTSPADRVRITSGSTVVTLDLHTDQELTFQSPTGGYNTVTVQDGKIAVTAADCPDHHCMDRGFCSEGTPIVCLPHQLVIQFLAEQEIDAMIG